MYKIMFYVGLIGAIIFLVVSIILFVRNNVAKVIGDVTGWNTKRAMKEIEKMRAEEPSVDMHVEVRNAAAREVDILLEDEKTALLPHDREETTLLEEVATLLAEGETSLLTEKLSEEKAGIWNKVIDNSSVPVGFFEVEESVTVTHTEERIDNE